MSCNTFEIFSLFEFFFSFVIYYLYFVTIVESNEKSKVSNGISNNRLRSIFSGVDVVNFNSEKITLDSKLKLL